MPGLPTAALRPGVGSSDVLGIGDMVRVATGVWAPEEMGDAAEPGKVTSVPTATAAPQRTVTVKAPPSAARCRARETLSRVTSPRRHRRNFSSDTSDYRWSTTVCTITLLLATGVTRARLASGLQVSQSGSLPLGVGKRGSSCHAQ
jgi:hypothetical protein